MRFTHNPARTIAGLAAAGTLAGGLALAAAPIAAADVPPSWSSHGEHMLVTSAGGSCQGTILVRYETDPARPGHLRVNLFPQGQMAEERCATDVTIGNFSPAGYQTQNVRVSGGHASAETFTGSGVNMVATTPTEFGLGVNAYVFVN